ncbi:MAG: hypothetical protein ACXVB0_00025 [Mucilaginibacter sp.]
MNIIAALSIGSLYQNIAFYTFIMLLVFLNFNLLKYLKLNKRLGSLSVTGKKQVSG